MKIKLWWKILIKRLIKMMMAKKNEYNYLYINKIKKYYVCFFNWIKFYLVIE